MDRQFRVAVVGATGLVGETMVSVLEERNFPVATLYALASERSLGRSVSCGLRAGAGLGKFDFAQCDFALFSASAAVSREHAPRAVARRLPGHRQHLGFRYREEVPLVVPEVNPQALDRVGTSGIIANPNCSTIQLMVALNRCTMPPKSSASTWRPAGRLRRRTRGTRGLARQSIAALSGKG
jgi:aspartate-semialdehyde dehydrogenase